MAGGNDERSPLLQNGQANDHQHEDEEVLNILACVIIRDASNPLPDHRLLQRGRREP